MANNTMVTRTLNSTEVYFKKATLDDNFQVKVEEGKCILDGSFTVETAQAVLSKKSKDKIKVTAVKNLDKIWGITLEDFIKYGREVIRSPSQMPEARAAKAAEQAGEKPAAQDNKKEGKA